VNPTHTVTAGSSPVVVDPTGGVTVAPGTTLHNGDPAVTISGTTISAGSTAATIVGPSGTHIVPFTNPSSTVAIGSQTFTEDPTGGLVLGPGTTLHPGDPPATVSGTTVSVGSTSVVLVGPSGTETIIMDPTATATPYATPYGSGAAGVGLNKLMLGGLAMIAVLFATT
jgi:hypothetical protein